MQSANVTPEISKILDEVPPNHPSVVVAGHYCLAEHMQELSAESDAEVMSFEFGTRFVAEANKKHKKSHLVLWINDIGISADAREAIKADYALPESYQKVLNGVALDSKHLTIMFESSMRNKASTLLRKLYKRQPHLFEKVSAKSNDLVRCIQSAVCEKESSLAKTAYVIPGPDAERLVVKEGPNPKCNLILATFFNELRQRFSPRMQINVFNQVYRYRLQLGIHVSRSILENTTPFHNVFCDGDDILFEPSTSCLR